MKKSLVILLFLLMTQVCSAQLQIDWQNCFMGPGDDKVNDVLALDDGYFILGEYNSTDVWLIRTDLYGNFLWDRKYGGSRSDEGIKIIKTNDGNYIIVALSFSEDFDLVNNPYPNSANYWIYKINPSGNILWSKIMGGNGPDWPNNATLTTDGGVIVVGQSQSFDGDVGINYGYWDIWAVKLDSLGNIVWAEVFGSDGAEWADEVTIDINGSVLIGGTTANVGVGNIDCNPFNEWGESLIIKFDSTLIPQWQQCYGGSLNELVTNITPANGGFYVSHNTESLDGDLYNSGFHGELDIWITKLDSNGNLIWGKCYGGSKKEAPSKIFYEQNGDLTLFGVTESNDGDVNGNHSPGRDIWVVKTDSSGTIKWQQCIGGNGNETSIAVERISNNTFVIAAMTFASFVSGDVNCNTTVQTGSDIWFLQITDTTVVSRKEDKFLTLKVFPNPADDYIYIHDDDHRRKLFSLYNLVGEKLITDIEFKNELYINIGKFSRGLYIYTVRDMVGDFTSGKLLIE